MIEPVRRPPVGRSVFIKLVAIMLGMTATLLFLVAGFFVLIASPSVIGATGRTIRELARTEAANSLDLAGARRLAAKLDLEIRYEGPRGEWSTSPQLPPIPQVSVNAASLRTAGQDYYIVTAPDGGRYLFAWTVGRRLAVVHRNLLVLLLFLMAGVVVCTYAFQRYLLRPLRPLGAGVARMSEGELDVVVPITSRDEFGVLTHAFNEMAQRVRQMMQARDQLLLDVSHELRSPVTRMKVALELLPDDENKTGMAADLNEMEAMVSELLELERLRTGRGLTRVRQDIVPIISEVAGRFHGRPPGIRLTLPAEPVLLDIDGEKIRTVLRNLLENAMKYSLPDSHAVQVEMKRTPEAVEIVVTDDGAGIPESEFANLFEPFYRTDRSRSRKTGGYGLGLSICKRILEAHGGTIAIQSNQARGVSFVVTLPGIG